jgi:hypothetical protein
MTRLLALVVATALAIAPSTSAWCRAWCDSQHPPATSSECHHHADSDAAGVTAGGSCVDVMAQAVVYVGADVPRLSAPVSATAHAYDTLRVLASMPHASDGFALVPPRSLTAACSRCTVLRI